MEIAELRQKGIQDTHLLDWNFRVAEDTPYVQMGKRYVNNWQQVKAENQVDEADLLDLLDEDELKDYTESQKPTEPAPTEPVQTHPTEPPVVTEDKNSGNIAALLPVALLAAGGIGGFIMLRSSKKKFQQVKPDPDADYQEDDDFELPEDSYDEE